MADEFEHKLRGKFCVMFVHASTVVARYNNRYGKLGF